MHFLTVNWNVSPEIFAIPVPVIRYGLILIGLVYAFFIFRDAIRKKRLPESFLFNLIVIAVVFVLAFMVKKPIPIRYYGALLVGGFVAAYFVLRSIFRREGLSQNLLDSMAITAAVSTIVGLRLGHCLFYEPSYYLAHPLEIIWPFRHGEFTGFQGLASHGGAIGILLGLLWWSHKYKKPYLWALERIVLIVPLAGAFVRIGNLMNSEIYGDVTNVPWGFVFLRDGNTQPHHPTQIYEALAYLAIFFFLWFLYTKKLPQLKRGMLFGIFLILLFGVRFLIEFIKEPQVGFEENMVLNMGQILSLPFIIAGIGILIWSWKKALPEVGWLNSGGSKKQAGSGQPAVGGKQTTTSNKKTMK